MDKTKKKEKKLIDTDLLKNKVFDSNNCVESINHLINSYIDANNKLGITWFEVILKTLFIRLNTKHSQNNLNKKKVIKYNLSDILLELIENGYSKNNKVIIYEDIKKLKSITKEEKYLNF